MALEPFKIRLTADSFGTLGQMKVRIELVDHAAVEPEPEEEPT